MIIDPIISKNAALIKDANGKDIERIYDRSGNLVFKNWNTLEGPFPIGCFTSSNKLRNYRIYGNTIQDGTPAPENPVEVQGCGERTENRFVIPVTVGGANLFDYNWLWTKENAEVDDFFNYITIVMKPNTEYTISNNYRVNKAISPYETALIAVNSETIIDTANGGVDRVRTVTTASDGLLIIAYRTLTYFPYDQDIVVNRDTLADGTYYIQINEGSSASPYEPYHEPITTPVYIGSEPLHKIGDYADYVDFKRGVVVRRIKKLVLMGREKWYTSSNYLGAVYAYHLQFSGIKPSTPIICSHLIDTTDSNYRQSSCKNDTNSVGLWMFDTTQSPTAFNRYLAAQYSAGTPVTVWYVLAEPEEEVLPLSQKIPTNIGSNTFSCTISPAPSKAMIQYKKK